jgi:hypothetical protein
MKVTVVMANDCPEAVLKGTLDENEKTIEKMKIEIADQFGSPRIYVRGYEFEIGVDK